MPIIEQPVLEYDSDHLYAYRLNHHFTPGLRGKLRLLAALIPTATGIGSLFQAIATLDDQCSYRPPGRVIDCNGCQMHLQTAGTGGPTVVLEAGLGGMSAAWGWIQPETAHFCRVVSYDRGGLGWSGPDSAPKSAILAAQRLHTILVCADIPPPYVLVGHSMGGLFIRVFADLYPHEVAGMVLLDAVHPDQHLRSTAISTHMRTGFCFLETIPLLTLLGYVRVAGIFNVWAEGLPEQQAAEARSFLSTYQHLKTTRDESRAWETICGEVRGSRKQFNFPVAVVTAAMGALPGHPELQRELAFLSDDSAHFAVSGADHVTLVTRKEYALCAVAAIRYVVEKVNTR
ncbi:MAG TPA: alpha/beta hydrolase [Desulfuromonadales bacterium]|nr:alpha/beta hydrolase [Desulfuromonadales bacterium]